jgi:putative glutamine amidotransferase
MDGITAIVFPGGEDISPSLFYSPQPVETREGISAERDVSDFLLMSWCLEEDIPALITFMISIWVSHIMLT